jgi:hypothetical protein
MSDKEEEREKATARGSSKKGPQLQARDKLQEPSTETD